MWLIQLINCLCVKFEPNTFIRFCVTPKNKNIQIYNISIEYEYSMVYIRLIKAGRLKTDY